MSFAAAAAPRRGPNAETGLAAELTRTLQRKTTRCLSHTMRSTF